MADQLVCDAEARRCLHAEPAAALRTASRVALSKKFARKSVALSSAMADSLAGGGAAAGVAMSKKERRSARSPMSRRPGFSGAKQEVPHRKERWRSPRSAVPTSPA